MSAQTTPFEIKSSKKLRSFAKKFERPAPPAPEATPAPAPRDNIFDRMDLANRIELDNSLDDTIDVVPQTRFIVIFIIFNVMKNYKDFNTERPLVTPASLVAYCLYQVYAFFLICDYYGRPATSFPASDYMNDDNRMQLLEHLCQSYVPPFMLTVFHALADCSDPRRPGLQYFATLAGSIFKHDFGRLIPAQVFQHAHNISADEDTSRNPATAMMHLLNTMLFNVETGNDIYVSQYFSAGYDATNHYNSFVYEALYTLFSPVTGKSLLRRSNLQHIPVQTQYISTDMNSTDKTYNNNQYVLFLNADKSNCRQMSKFITAMSTIMKTDAKATFQLGAIPDDLNGTNILVHGYTLLTLPTWHSAKHVTITSTKGSHDAEDYAAAIQFLQPHKDGPTSKFDYSVVMKALTGSLKTLFLGQDNGYDTNRGPSYVTFDENIHPAPRTLYLDPYTSGDGPISYAMIAGLLIESFEIDGSSVPMPNSEIGLSKNNRQFLQGSIPMSHAHSAWSNSGLFPYHPYSREIMKKNYQAISHDLYTMSKNRLGMIDKEIITTGLDVTSGFQVLEHVRSAREMFSKLSFSTETTTHPTAGLTTIDAWSPYRYVLSDDDEHPQEATTYMLINRRTEYGTSVPLVGSRHPSEILPIS